MTFDEWRATKRWFDKLEDHAAGSSDTGGYGYQPGWIAKVGDGLLQDDGWWTLAGSEDYSTEVLADAEAWLWMHYAHYEV